MREIIKNSFWQLLSVYTLLVIAIALGFLGKYALQMHLLAILLGILGIFAVSRFEKENIKINNKLHYTLLIISILIIILLRIIPYLGNSIPLGYDTGLYKYGIEHGLQNLDIWILSGGMEPGFLYLMKPLSFL